MEVQTDRITRKYSEGVYIKKLEQESMKWKYRLLDRNTRKYSEEMVSNWNRKV